MDQLLRLVGISPDTVIFGNPLLDWAAAIGLGLATFATLLVVRSLLARRARHFANLSLPSGIRVFPAMARRTLLLPLLAISMAVASKYLDLPARVERFADIAIVMLVALQSGLWLSVAVSVYLEEKATASAARGSQSMLVLLHFIINLVVWAVVVLVALDNLGVQVKALLTGLGIGGIAVALAVQNVLGDLLASISILLDKPFEVGDTLTLDAGYVGTVEAIGIKSTRLRAVSGEQIVVSNAELLKVRIRNQGRIRERRSVFRFALATDTPTTVLAELPDLVRASIEKEAPRGTLFERATLVTIGAQGFEIEASFVVATSDYATFLSVQQAIHLSILAGLEARHVRFAPASVR